MQYTFESLSPIDFEDLTRDLIQQELALTLESFKPGRDQGIDLRHSRDNEANVIIQCKHYRGSGFAKLLSHLRDSELSKIKKLKPNRYVLSTSVPLSPKNKAALRKLLAPFVRSPQDIYGANDLNGLLAKFPEIERRHFKLWLGSSEALERFFTRAERVRADALVERAKAKIKLYATNDSFNRALDILKEHRVCVIAGAPGIGKTTLADVLMVHHLNQGYEVIEISRDIGEADATYRPESKQFFYYDDFLGTAFDEALPKNEDSRLASFIARIAGMANKRLVLTTREYILRNAANRYERVAHTVRVERKCIISMADYTTRVKAKILYNHVYFSELRGAARMALVENAAYTNIISHANFNPRLVEHAIAFAVAKAIPPSGFPAFVVNTLDNPKVLWEHAFRSQLPAETQCILLALAFLPRGVFLEDLSVAASSLAEHRLGAVLRPTDFRQGLRLLDGTFIVTESRRLATPRTVIDFPNPAIRDYILRYVDEEPHELLPVLIGSRYFETIINVWRAANTQDEDGKLRYPGLARALQERGAQLKSAFSANLAATTCQPAREQPHYSNDYESQPWEDERIREAVEVASRSPGNVLRGMGAWILEKAYPRWLVRKGLQSSIARIVAKHEVPKEIRIALGEWATAELETVEAFDLVAELEVHQDPERAHAIKEAFERFVDAEADYILYEARSEDEAESTVDAVNSLSTRLGFAPHWDEDAIQGRIAELAGPDPEPDDFDYDEVRDAHAERAEREQDEERERDDIADLFATLAHDDQAD